MEHIAAFRLVLEQTHVLCFKHFSQKRRGGRTSLKETFVIPFFIFLATGILMSVATNFSFPSANYDLHGLPALSKDINNWGIFNANSPDNNDDTYGYVDSTNLYYSPSGHPGVDTLMRDLQAAFPTVRTTHHTIILTVIRLTNVCVIGEHYCGDLPHHGAGQLRGQYV